MFDILRQSLATGLATTSYPATPPEVSEHTRGRPLITLAGWQDARPAAAACPTEAIAWADADGQRTVTFDLGRCVFCGLCAEVDPAIRMTPDCELAVRRRGHLVQTARYRLRPDGSQQDLITETAEASAANLPAEKAGQELRAVVRRTLGRSLHIRHVDAGSCNGCEVEITNLSSPVYDLERFGLHLVASPRHADLLLVTGPVTLSMEVALRKTYAAMPTPRLVVAVGACGCSGGVFGRSYASLGGVDQVLPVDVYIPGCPPNPFALLHGIRLAVERAGPANPRGGGTGGAPATGVTRPNRRS
jgi:Ni,Fe-hydrogenase III small subunit/formate hydrogenlyase subunit 6/NADH:ubiquinone oxidoreductase subunit I